MTPKELSSKLIQMYAYAEAGEQITTIHLYGIKYVNELKRYNLKCIVNEAGVPLSYIAEIRKGMNLAKYVRIK